MVFDGYPEHPTTKDHAHQVRERSSRYHGSKDVTIDPSKKLVLTRDQFLSKTRNKKNFICLLVNALKAENIKVHLAYADANVLIAKTAVELAKTVDVTVIGEDTDLVVLLWHYIDLNSTSSIVLQTVNGSRATIFYIANLCFLRLRHYFSNPQYWQRKGFPRQEITGYL